MSGATPHGTQCSLTVEQDPALLLLNVDVYPLNVSNQPKLGASVFSQQAMIKSLRECGAYHAHSGRNLKEFRKVSGLVFKHICLSSKSIIFILHWGAGAAASLSAGSLFSGPHGGHQKLLEGRKRGERIYSFLLACWFCLHHRSNGS